MLFHRQIQILVVHGISVIADGGQNMVNSGFWIHGLCDYEGNVC